EPLGHLLRMATAAVGSAAGHRKQRAEIGGGSGRGTEALRYQTEHQRAGEYMVVPCELTDPHLFDAGLLLQLPVFRAQGAASLAQFGFAQRALPECLQRLLQLSVTADPGEAEGMGEGHGSLR